MILISARENFWSDTKLAVSDAIKEVDLVGDATSVDIDENELFTAIAENRILLLVHGYNNEPEDVHNAYAIVESNIIDLTAGQYDCVIGYIWPGGDDPLDYFAAKTRSNALARRVGIWLQKMSDKKIIVDVMGHSMGVRVILKALKTRTNKVVRNVYAMAAAVDNESIQYGEEFFLSTQRCHNMFVFHSKYDATLSCLYRIAEFDRALGLVGPENPADIMENFLPGAAHSAHSLYVANCKNIIRTHGAYKHSSAIYNYISNFLANRRGNQFSTL